jgi:hypothetical protein
MAYHKYFPHTSLKPQLVFKKKHLSNLEWPEGKINGRYSQRSPTSLTNGLAKSKLHNEDTIAYKILRATTTQDYNKRNSRGSNDNNQRFHWKPNKDSSST